MGDGIAAAGQDEKRSDSMRRVARLKAIEKVNATSHGEAIVHAHMPCSECVEIE